MAAVEVVCVKCGGVNPPGARFCSSCGAAIAEAPLQEERKLVSVLFVDLVDSTARADKADPEDVRDVLQLYHRQARECIEQYGGVLEKFIGDAVMAVFGAPVAHGDDAERAVRAALRVLERIEQLNTEHGLDLAARAAVDTGEAIVSVEHARTGGALATGDVVNTASRLQNAAPPGRVVVGAETHRATRNAVRYEELAAVAAKGKGDPVPAWLAVEAVTGPAERPLGDAPLVGRNRELELLQSVWNRAVHEARPHLVTLVGPPGIGKSRLCREVTGFVSTDGGRIVRGRCLPYEEKAGYQSFSRVVHHVAGILESDSSAAARAKLESAIRELVPTDEAGETARYLSLLLGLAPEDEVPDRGLLFFAARRFIECAALVQPTVFVFEDVHWADGTELELLSYLGQHVRDAPALLVATARPELLDAHPTWGAGLVAQTTMPLEPLSEDAAQTLAARLVEIAGAKAVDPTRLVDVAGGNPLFLEELAASVAELGDTEELPVTVREAIASRIDAMPSSVRDALLSAAVIGKTFWRGVLAAIGRVTDVDEALHVLEARDFVRRDPSSQIAGDVQFTFKHMLIREVAYATVPRALRRERHAAVAGYIEDTLVAGETLSTILAYHWREAGEPGRAIPYLLDAADAARRSWAKEALIELYTRASELAEGEDVRRRILLQRGLALVELSEYQSAVEELTAVLPALSGAERMDALIGLGDAYIWTERHDETLATAAQALPLAYELADETAIPAALAMESEGLAMRGDEGDLDRALELGDRALELWVPDTRHTALASFLDLHANLMAWRGDYERAAALSQREYALARDVHSAEWLLRGGGHEALALVGLGRHEEAIPIWDELFEVARDLEQNQRTLLNYSSIAYRELYDLEEARARSAEALELSEGRSFGMPLQFAGSDLIWTDLLAGDVGAAQAAWPERWAFAEHATGWTRWLILGRHLAARAEIALGAESPEAAAEWANRALAVARRTRRPKYEARTLMTLGQALARLRRTAEALDALRTAVRLADDLIGPPARWDARAALGRVAYDIGEDDEAATAYEEAAELVEGFSATLAPQRAATLAKSPVVSEIRSLVKA
jgi:class 3 adenylate cyclase/tetratricopeptide (TPR) repeat protein